MAGTQFQQRRNTADQWPVNNRVLAAGELGIETDTQLVKVGDGVTAWTALPYIGYYPQGGKAADSELLDGTNSFEFLLKTEAASSYTPKSAKVSDTDLLDGYDLSKFMRADVARATYDLLQPLTGTANDRPPSPWVNQKYFDTTLNELIAWNGTRWQKVGGPTRYIGGTSAMGSSGQIPVQSKVAVRSVIVSAHTPGEVKLSAAGVWTADVGQAVNTELWVGSTSAGLVQGSGQRTHNGKNGATAATTLFRNEGYFLSPGNTFTLTLAILVEANTPTFILDGSFSAWLGAIPL